MMIANFCSRNNIHEYLYSKGLFNMGFNIDNYRRERSLRGENVTHQIKGIQGCTEYSL